MTVKSIVPLLISFIISSNLKGQVFQGTEEITYQDDKIESSMWGQVKGQRLPSFYVTNEDFEYPEEALKKKIQGQVDILFQINADGDIVDSTIQIVNGLSKELDEEAIQVVKNSSTRKRWFIIPNNWYLISLVFRITEKNWANYYFTLGARAYKKEDYQDAIKYFDLSISFDEKNAKYHYSLYKVFSDIGKSDKACACLKKAKKLNRGFKTEWKAECK